MDALNLTTTRLTSVSLRKESFQRLKVAQKTLSGKAIFRSEQAMFRGLIRLYLNKWRGGGGRTGGLRRYNLRGKEYLVKPLYLEMELAFRAWGRAVHSGVSVSRMLDFAIRHYLPLFVQGQMTDQVMPSHDKSAINYQCFTWKNSDLNLYFMQRIDYRLPQAMPP